MSFEEFFDKPPLANWYDIKVYPNKDGISIFFQVTTEKGKLKCLEANRKRKINDT
jgi:hypothetical protein